MNTILSIVVYQAGVVSILDVGLADDIKLLSTFDTDGVDILEPGVEMPWRYHQVDAAKLPFQIVRLILR